jgi:uncharacterized protein
MELLPLLIAILAAGLFAGFLGGLFGIGGGIVIVPALYFALGFFDVADEVRIKVAVATSLATIIVTSLRSLSAHSRKGAVDFAFLRVWGPWIAVGAVFGGSLARYVDADWMIAVFAIGAAVIGLHKFFFPITEKAEKNDLSTQPKAPPKGIVPIALASLIGTLSSLMGIGGGVMGVVVLTAYRKTIHQAVATASGFGVAIAVPGTIAMGLAGRGAEGLPPFSMGFVNIPGFVLIALMTFITAPVGAKTAHALPQKLLNRIFSLYLIFTALLLMREVII